MEQIRLHSSIRNRSLRERSKSSIKFNTCNETGYIPLLKVLSSFNNGFEDYFNGSFQVSVHAEYKYHINFRSAQNVVSFTRRGRDYSQINYNNPVTFSFSMLSVLGLPTKRHLAIAQMSPRNDGPAIVTNAVDVLALAVIKITDIKKIEFTKSYVNIDPSIIKILISEEKFSTPQYMTTFYNKTIRSHIVRELNALGVEKEKVSDKELEKYYSNPYTFKSNSIMEIMKHDQKIKESVLSTLNKKMIVT